MDGTGCMSCVRGTDIAGGVGGSRGCRRSAGIAGCGRWGLG